MGQRKKFDGREIELQIVIGRRFYVNNVELSQYGLAVTIGSQEWFEIKQVE